MSEGFDLRQLRSFVVLAEELHFGRAARRLGLAQPSLTQQILRLEQAIGHAVVMRRPRVALTPAGERLLRNGRSILDQAQRGLDEVKRAGRGEIGRLVVGFGSSVLLAGLARILRDYQRRFPGVLLELEERPSSAHFDALRSGEIDVSLTRAPELPADLESLVLHRERLMLALPPRHRLGGRRRVSWSQLSGERLVLFPRAAHPRLHDVIVERCRAAGFEPRVVQESTETLTLLALVEAGVGIAVLTDSFEPLRLGGVSYARMPEPLPAVDVAVCWRRGEMSPALRNFIALARERPVRSRRRAPRAPAKSGASAGPRARAPRSQPRSAPSR